MECSGESWWGTLADLGGSLLPLKKGPFQKVKAIIFQPVNFRGRALVFGGGGVFFRCFATMIWIIKSIGLSIFDGLTMNLAIFFLNNEWSRPFPCYLLGIFDIYILLAKPFIGRKKLPSTSTKKNPTKFIATYFYTYTNHGWIHGIDRESLLRIPGGGSSHDGKYLVNNDGQQVLWAFQMA